MGNRWGRVAVPLVAAVLMVGCRSPAPTTTLDDVARALPDQLAGWQAGEGARYDPETIYSYIDGHAEVYLAYGMRECAARRYEGPAGEPAIVVDVFELGSPADAYGVFTYDRDGTAVAVGQGGLLRHGWLSFWQGRFFVSVYAEAETAAAEAAVRALGDELSAAVPPAGTIPEIVTRLPSAGLEPRSVRFLRNHLVLNTHRWVSSDNVLGLGPQTAAALGRYRRDGAVGDLLLVRYPDEGAAARGFAGFAGGLLGGRDDGAPVADANGAWWAAAVAGENVTAVLAASSSELAATLLAEAGLKEGGR